MECSISVANWFIERGLADGQEGMCPIRVQKLVYLAYGWHLALTGKPLTREVPLARSWGPYFPQLLKHISGYFTVDDPIRGVLTNGKVSADLEAFLERIWQVYYHLSSAQLSALVTSENSPWMKTICANLGRVNPQISDADIENYYKSKLNSKESSS